LSGNPVYVRDALKAGRNNMRALQQNIRYECYMAKHPGSAQTSAHLRDIAARLREAYTVPAAEDPTISDLMTALDNPELREILLEMQNLRDEELQRLERLLSRHAANDR
jgi:hypothetical protein